MAQETILRKQMNVQIKHDIILRKLSSREPLHKNQFLDRSKVSKRPIADALTSLVRDGLVECARELRLYADAHFHF